MQLIFAKQEFEGLDTFVNVAQDLIRQRIDRAHRWGQAARLGEEILGILSHPQLAVTIGKDAAIESRADQGVLEASLKEMLDDQGLELDLDLEFGHFALELIGSDKRRQLCEAA